MDDFLAEGKPFRKIAEFLHLPVPMPAKLQRAQGAWQNNELAGKTALVSGEPLTTLLTGFGIQQAQATDTCNALVFDASNIATVEGLNQLYSFFHNNIRRLGKCGRVIIIGRKPSSLVDVEAATAQQAIEGFNRSLAKEIGRKGSTANLVRLNGEYNVLENKLSGVLRFLLSARSAYVSGQTFKVDDKATLPSAIAYNQPLQGKVALVTGSARGIGRSIAIRLAQEGAKVVVLDRKEEGAEAQAVAKEMNGEALLLDITDANAPKTIAQYFSDQFGGIDIVVHNAGITRDKTLANMDERLWQQVLQVNLQAAININNQLLGGLLRNEGRIVCMASISGIGGNFGQTNYAASKAGFIGYARALSKDVANKGITVNAIAPGFIETQMTAKVPFFTREAGRRLNALAQGGLPIDVAEMAVFMAMPSSAGVTGQAIRVCGANMMGA